jgi:ribonucleoside-triphosphate reductase
MNNQSSDVKILSDITVYMKYAKYVKELNRRETWSELVDRNMQMHVRKFPELKEEITDIYNRFIHTKKILPSMRSMQFAGRPIELNNARIFNCSYMPLDHWRAFPEAMFLLLSGCGLGYSVQKHHVDELPEIKKPSKKRSIKYVVSDNIEGWAMAIEMLVKSYFFNKSTVRFVFDDIRPKGSMLITSGGKAPGPQPLKDCIYNITKILDSKEEGSKLSSIEAHDIMCFIADAVLAGGIRRSALISLFSIDDSEMIAAKSGNWWELNPQRGRANNSAVLLRHKVDKDTFLKLWEKIEASNSGEPGLYLTNDKDWGSNP